MIVLIPISNSKSPEKYLKLLKILNQRILQDFSIYSQKKYFRWILFMFIFNLLNDQKIVLQKMGILVINLIIRNTEGFQNNIQLFFLPLNFNNLRCSHVFHEDKFSIFKEKFSS